MTALTSPHAGVRCLLGDGFVPLLAGGKLCSSHLLPLAMVCYGKARRNLESARAEVRRRGKNVNRTYQCPVCSSSHVGQFKQGRPDGTIRAAEIVRELRAAGFGWYLGQLAGDWHPSNVHRDSTNRWRVRIST